MVDPLHRPVALGDAGAALPVEPDGVDLVEIGHRTVLLGDVADIGDRGEVAVHRVERLEGDDLRRVRVAFGEQPVEMRDIVVAKDLLLGAAVADPGDHRGVVVGIRYDHAARHGLPQRAERRLVGDISRGEQERRLGPVEPGELLLKQDVVVGGPRNVAGAARPGAYPVQRLVHCRDDPRVLAHAEIVVAAPHGDVLDRTAVVARGDGKRPGAALEIGENPIAAVAPQVRYSIGEKLVVIHRPQTLSGACARAYAPPIRL